MQQLAQKESKTMHDWVGKLIYWESFMRLRFSHADKCYTHKLESATRE